MDKKQVATLCSITDTLARHIANPNKTNLNVKHMRNVLILIQETVASNNLATLCIVIGYWKGEIGSYQDATGSFLKSLNDTNILSMYWQDVYPLDC